MEADGPATQTSREKVIKTLLPLPFEINQCPLSYKRGITSQRMSDQCAMLYLQASGVNLVGSDRRQ